MFLVVRRRRRVPGPRARAAFGRIVVVVSSLVLFGTAAAQQRSVFALVSAASAASAERQWDEAAALWQAVTSVNPTRAVYWTQLARARRGAGDFTGAIEALEMELQLGARARSDIIFDIARSHGAAGRPEQALAWLPHRTEEFWIETDGDIDLYGLPGRRPAGRAAGYDAISYTVT